MVGMRKTKPKLAQKWSKKGHFWTSEGERPKPTPLPLMQLWFNMYSVQNCDDLKQFQKMQERKCLLSAGRWKKMASKTFIMT